MAHGHSRNYTTLTDATVRLDDGEGRRLVRAIFNLTRSLRLECVFEGIETEMQLMEATLAGFHYAQGYFIERPVALDVLLERQAARAA